MSKASDSVNTTPGSKSTGGEIRSGSLVRINRKDSEAEDLLLLARIARSDADALSRLYDKYQRKVYSAVLQIVRNQEDAAEVLQDVFLQVWEKAGLFDGDRGTFGAWLATLAHNKAINVLRSRRFKKSALEIKQDFEQLSGILSAQTVDSRTALDNQIEDDERKQMLALLDQIPETQRTALILAYYSGYSQSEIAENLEIPLGTVKTRMRQGMIKLRELLDGR